MCTHYYMIRVCVCSCTVKRQSRAGFLIRLSIFIFDLLDCECVDIIIEKQHEYIYYVLDIVGTDADVASGDVFTLLLSNDFDVGFNDRLCCPVHFAFLCD